MAQLPALLQHHRDELKALCVLYQVRRLELFGAAACGDWDPHRSTLQFLIEFREIPPHELFDHCFGLHVALEELLGRKVKLVMTQALTNPYFLEDIASSRALLYAA